MMRRQYIILYLKQCRVGCGGRGGEDVFVERMRERERERASEREKERESTKQMLKYALLRARRMGVLVEREGWGQCL